jgi:hypothetical protein
VVETIDFDDDDEASLPAPLDLIQVGTLWAQPLATTIIASSTISLHQQQSPLFQQQSSLHQQQSSFSRRKHRSHNKLSISRLASMGP